MMDRPNYLHVHIPGRGWLTLSLPGVERGLARGRIPADAEAWHAGLGLWVTLRCHPAVVRMLADTAAVEAAFTEELPPVGADVDSPTTLGTLELFPGATADAAVGSEPGVVAEAAMTAVVPDPAQLPLIPLPLIPLDHSTSPDFELSRFVALSQAQEQRRDAIRNSGGARPSGAMRVFVAGSEKAESEAPDRREGWRPYIGAEVVASLVILVAVAVTGFLIAGRQVPTAGDVAVLRYSNESSAGLFGQEVTGAKGTRTFEVSRNPLAGPERDLESDLQIADIVTWQPAVDFSSEEQTLRATRKVDAVRNVISLYRVNAWRLMDGLHRDADPWLEPYSESSRIDDVLDVMKSAIILLDSAVTRFQVDGERLVFESETEAERYLALRSRADSLLQAPVEQDSFPAVRPPRRVVTRLLASLPPAISQFRVQ